MNQKKEWKGMDTGQEAKLLEKGGKISFINYIKNYFAGIHVYFTKKFRSSVRFLVAPIERTIQLKENSLPK